VSLLIFALSFVITVASGLKKATDRLGADLLIVPIGARDYAEEMLLEIEAKTCYMDKNIIHRVKKIEGIEKLTHQTYLSTVFGICCDVTDVTVIAFDQETDFIVKPWLEKAIGRELSKGEAIIGYEANENLGLLEFDTEVEVGKKVILLFNNKFKIAGVLEKTGTGLDNAIFIDDENIEAILKKGKSALKLNQISLIFTKVREDYDPYKVGREVEGEIIEVDVIARSDIGKGILRTLKDINRIFLIAIILSTLLAILLVGGLFSAIANERIKEVGIMRAIGAKESHILKIFLLEVFLLGAIGSTLGIISGSILSTVLSKDFVLLQNVSATLTGFEKIGICVSGFVMGIGICIIGALSPIIKIKKIEPLLAIKEE
jgi:putative ABC transport system permease protein